MTTEQIIKALECCTQKDEKGWVSPVCVDCPFSIGKDDCKALDEYALALIKELQAHNENLKRENKYLRERLAEEAEHKDDMAGG